MSVTEKKKNAWNKKIVKSRAPDWRLRMMNSKIEHAAHPSLLRIARLKAGKSQDEIAQAAELSLTTYGDIERSKRPVRSEMAARLAELVGVKKLEAIFERKEKNSRKFVARRDSPSR